MQPFRSSQVPSKGYSLLSSWWDVVTTEVQESYPAVETTVVAWEVLKVDASAKKAFVIFPAFMESHWKSFDYFKERYVLKKIPEGFLELSFGDFYAAEATSAEEKAVDYFRRATKLEALGTSIICPEEDGEEVFSTCCQQTRSKRLKTLLPLELSNPAPNSSLEKKRVKALDLLQVCTPLFNPLEYFNCLRMTLASKLSQSLGPLRGYSAGVLTHVCIRYLTEEVFIPFMEIAGWNVQSLRRNGHFELSSGNISIVQQTIASSSLTLTLCDPLKRITFVDSDAIAANMQEYSKYCDGKITTKNPRDSSLTKDALIAFAKDELGDHFPENEVVSKAYLAKRIVEQRISSQSFVGFKTLTKVVINNHSLFKIKISPGRHGTSIITCFFNVSHYTFKAEQHTGVRAKKEW